jgi:hypothetical protein
MLGLALRKPSLIMPWTSGRAMPAYRKASIRDLTQAAITIDGRFIQGVLHQDPESGIWMVGSTSLDEWFGLHKGEDVTLILVSMEDDRPLDKRTCRTCGRDYFGYECPHCREVRFRLRGQ